ncbi:MAG TPA: ornithine carbamoyltransferase [Gammaproteobacteria bacterium]|nr:ornithine carbamoyltransferase [Gammaproteobacteria bacterium]
MVRHYLSELDLTAQEFKNLLARATELKKQQLAGQLFQPLKGKVLGMIFEKSSTRTRVSFEAGMVQLGGSAIFLSPNDTQLGRGEPIEDTARVLSQMVDAVMIRTYNHKTVERFAEYASIPVINGLTDVLHPCQLLADMQTWFEHRGDIKGKRVVWVGDGNNMCNSYINTAKLLEFELIVSCPADYEPDPKIVASGDDYVTLEPNPSVACQGADIITTDVWASMGQEDEMAERRKAFANYQVTPELMKLANPDALFLHCLPAHRGEEVSSAVLDDPKSVVWDQAGNRLHAQKALLEMLIQTR